jgi:hypothetical protein
MGRQDRQGQGDSKQLRPKERHFGRAIKNVLSEVFALGSATVAEVIGLELTFKFIHELQVAESILVQLHFFGKTAENEGAAWRTALAAQLPLEASAALKQLRGLIALGFHV